MKATGGEKWQVSHRTTTEAKATEFERLGKGGFSAMEDLILVSVYVASSGAHHGADNELVNESLGLPKPGSLDVVVGRIVKGQKL